MFTFTAQKANAAIIFKIDRSMISIMDDVNKLTNQDPKSSMSSNPYSYINNANYKSIIELG